MARVTYACGCKVYVSDEDPIHDDTCPIHNKSVLEILGADEEREVL